MINLPGGQAQLFIYHLAERAPPLFDCGFEEGNFKGWAEPLGYNDRP